ncbi:conserved hypothetical protein [Culex quinquefasciatus]|uniref:Protein SYS1 homolog n=1 Tax=Culex quinquefasciatus TaxID=7176 RepID=B0WJY7_CULQU|nr:conserved hypothetical protein [Culex quinquefasciatus]|eukprot:XP_001849021.1 conserved hypothetical protein [Culex quinquefasciatus]
MKQAATVQVESNDLPWLPSYHCGEARHKAKGCFLVKARPSQKIFTEEMSRPRSRQRVEIHVTDLGGRLVIFAFVLNSLVGSGALWFVVRRTKLCLDFAVTFHVIHLVVCWWYNSAFPATISWWLLNAVCTALMCVGGEFLCLKTEMREIPVGYSALNNKVDL